MFKMKKIITITLLISTILVFVVYRNDFPQFFLNKPKIAETVENLISVALGENKEDGWTFGSNEGRDFMLPNTTNEYIHLIRFGNERTERYYYIKAEGNIRVDCHYSKFGDPAPGSKKQCWYKTLFRSDVPSESLWIPSRDGFVYKVSQGHVYHFHHREFNSCMATWGYGRNNLKIYKHIVSRIKCDNELFGNVLPGTSKGCYFNSECNPTLPSMSLCAEKGDWCKIGRTIGAPFFYIRYGSEKTGRLIYVIASNKITSFRCDDNLFGDAKECNADYDDDDGEYDDDGDDDDDDSDDNDDSKRLGHGGGGRPGGGQGPHHHHHGGNRNKGKPKCWIGIPNAVSQSSLEFDWRFVVSGLRKYVYRVGLDAAVGNGTKYELQQQIKQGFGFGPFLVNTPTALSQFQLAQNVSTALQADYGTERIIQCPTNSEIYQFHLKFHSLVAIGAPLVSANLYLENYICRPMFSGPPPCPPVFCLPAGSLTCESCSPEWYALASTLPLRPGFSM